MESWTNPTTTEPRLWRAVVRPERLSRSVVRCVLPGTGALEPWVEQVWSLAWSEPLPTDLTTVISHPTIHLTVEAGPPDEVRHGRRLPAALLHGVATERFAPALPAHGWVVGLHLRPGAIADLTGAPADRWTGRVADWADAWPGWNLDAIWRVDGPQQRAEVLSEIAAARLAGRQPSADGLRAREVERLVRDDPSVRTVEELARRQALSPRSLQRLCREHLGVTPRWLLRRARVIDAHELLSTTDLEPAEIAQRLGWYDQAHLTRDYTRLTGTAPVRLRRERRQDG